MPNKPKGFGKFDNLMRKLVKVPASELPCPVCGGTGKVMNVADPGCSPCSACNPMTREEAERAVAEAGPNAEPLTEKEIDDIMEFAKSGGKRGGMKPRKPKSK